MFCQTLFSKPAFILFCVVKTYGRIPLNGSCTNVSCGTDDHLYITNHEFASTLWHLLSSCITLQCFSPSPFHSPLSSWPINPIILKNRKISVYHYVKNRKISVHHYVSSTQFWPGGVPRKKYITWTCLQLQLTVTTLTEKDHNFVVVVITNVSKSNCRWHSAKVSR